MAKPTVLITGANGEVGSVLSQTLSESDCELIGVDIRDLAAGLKPFYKRFVKADILDKKLVAQIIDESNIDYVYHLAAVLSTSAEKNPEMAHRVNVDGTATLLELINQKASAQKKPIKFIFPSTVAIYGVPNLETKSMIPPIKEADFNAPITMYGINKLYCEHLGVYYSQSYQLLAGSRERYLDFRAVRFPGLISAHTIPSGGTSDYAPEMLHTAAQGKAYESFVREDTTLPFMAMPDAARALISLAQAPKEKLTKRIYNVSALSISAEQIAEIVTRAFPETAISYNPDHGRQKIVDSWPADMDDSAARNDWGWSPVFDQKKTFEDYLIPEIQEKYQSSKN